jgi:carboxymethylenebutenolidase
MRSIVVALAAIGLMACERTPDDATAPAPRPTAAERTAGEAAPTESEPGIALLEQDLAYGEAEKRNLVGFLAMPADAAEPPPGLIVIHELWGLNDDIRAFTRQLAARGYVALAVDLYTGQRPATREHAERLRAAVVSTPEMAQANLGQAYEYLERYALSPRVGVIGWDLGGEMALRTAIALPEQLDAVVMYYGALVIDPEQLRPLQMPILGFFGELDKGIDAREVRDFRRSLASLGKTSRVVLYRDAGHGFASPSDSNYNRSRAAEAWETTVEFLAEHMQK